MSFTAIANGANYLITEYGIPEDSLHWENFGIAMNTIRKAGPGLIDAPRVITRACFLFPRTQHLQLQEEYFNVGLSFESFLRAFGELDIINEYQVREGKLMDYDILILCDVKLLPDEVARQIVQFVNKGGYIVSDCVPRMDAYKQPSIIMTGFFCFNQAETSRVIQKDY